MKYDERSDGMYPLLTIVESLSPAQVFAAHKPAHICGKWGRLSPGEEFSRATVAKVRVRPVYEEPTNSTVVEKGGGLSYSTAVECSTIVENLRPDTDEVLAAALVRLGCTKKGAARRLAIAHERLLAEQREATEENLMLEAPQAWDIPRLWKTAGGMGTPRGTRRSLRYVMDASKRQSCW